MAGRDDTVNPLFDVPSEPHVLMDNLQQRIEELGLYVRALRERGLLDEQDSPDTIVISGSPDTTDDGEDSGNASGRQDPSQTGSGVAFHSTDTVEIGSRMYSPSVSVSMDGMMSARQAAVGLERELEERVRARTEELRKENEQLRESLNSAKREAHSAEQETVRLASLIENSPVAMIVMADDGIILHVNARFTQVFGYDLNHLQDFDSLVALVKPRTGTHEMFVSDWTDQMSEVDPGETVTRTFSFKSKSGEEVFVHCRTSRLKTGEYCIVFDDTPPAQAEPAAPQLKHAAPKSGELMWLFHSALDAVSDGILITDEDGIPVLLNRRLTSMWDLPEDVQSDPVGSDIFTLISQRMKSREEFLGQVARLATAPDEESFDVHELRDRRVMESTSWTETTRDGKRIRIWMFRDVTEARRAEVGLKESELKYRTVVEARGLGVFSTDRRGRLTTANNDVIRMLGFADERSARKSNLIENPVMAEAGISDALARCIQTGERFFSEFPFRNHAGAQIYCRLYLIPVGATDGSARGVHGVMEDISTQKRAEKLVLESQRLKVMGQMASGVGHTFSNMLQIVTGNVNMSLTNMEIEDFDEVKVNLNQILESTRTATEAVRRLQHFGRERPRKDTPRKAVFDLNDSVVEGVEMCKLWSKGKLEREQIEIAQDLDLSDGCHVEGEQDQLAWVVLNFLKNSVEALPKGGSIKVRTYAKDDHVALEIQDTGIGIPEKDLRKITEAFWTSKESHAGMGLAVNCGIIRNHRGNLGVKRLSPRGTAFTVKLPKASSPTRPKEEPARPRSMGPKKYRVLLIDDEKPVVQILGKGLKKRGCTTYTASSGQDGLNVLEKNDVDAIVCDLGMEGMNGWEVSDRVKELCDKKQVSKPPFILLTGWGGQLAEDEINYHPHVDRIVEKPVTIPGILDIIGEEVDKVHAKD